MTDLLRGTHTCTLVHVRMCSYNHFISINDLIKLLIFVLNYYYYLLLIISLLKSMGDTTVTGRIDDKNTIDRINNEMKFHYEQQLNESREEAQRTLDELKKEKSTLHIHCTCVRWVLLYVCYVHVQYQTKKFTFCTYATFTKRFVVLA